MTLPVVSLPQGQIYKQMCADEKLTIAYSPLNINWSSPWDAQDRALCLCRAGKKLFNCGILKVLVIEGWSFHMFSLGWRACLGTSLAQRTMTTPGVASQHLIETHEPHLHILYVQTRRIRTQTLALGKMRPLQRLQSFLNMQFLTISCERNASFYATWTFRAVLWSDAIARAQGATGLDCSLMGIRLQIISLKIWSSSRGFSMFSPRNGLALNFL